MSVKCPVCKRQWGSSLQVARHVFGTVDEAHAIWVNAQGVWFRGVVVQQPAPSGNQGFVTLPEIIEEWQDKI